MSLPEYVTRQEAADILGISLSTLDKMIDDGRVPALRLTDRTVRIAKSDLDPDVLRGRIEGRTL